MREIITATSTRSEGIVETRTDPIAKTLDGGIRIASIFSAAEAEKVAATISRLSIELADQGHLVLRKTVEQIKKAIETGDVVAAFDAASNVVAGAKCLKLFSNTGADQALPDVYEIGTVVRESSLTIKGLGKIVVSGCRELIAQRGALSIATGRNSNTIGRAMLDGGMQLGDWNAYPVIQALTCDPTCSKGPKSLGAWRYVAERVACSASVAVAPEREDACRLYISDVELARRFEGYFNKSQAVNLATSSFSAKAFREALGLPVPSFEV